MGDNFAPVVQIVTLFLLITSVIGVTARGATKAAVVRSISLDDYLISISLLFAIGQSVTVYIQTKNGFGNPLKASTPSQLKTDLKSDYIGSLFYIPTLCFAKLAVLALIRTITPVQKDQLIAFGLACIISLWAISAEFAIAFDCRVPEPWNYLAGHCFDRYTWWSYLETSNIITDLALILLPLACIRRLQASLAKRASAFSFFALRIIVIVAAACKLVFLRKTQHVTDPILNTWPVTLCTQTVQCLSIVSACFLYLKPFLDSVEAGFIRNNDMRRQASGDAYYRHNPGGSSSNRRTSFIVRNHKHSIGLRNLGKGRHATTVTGGNLGAREDAGSQHSDAHMIRETRTFAVEESMNVRRSLSLVQRDLEAGS